jgi:hypothetical protein
MKKRITLGLIAIFAMVTVNAQNIVIDDFEGGAKAWEEGVYPLDEGDFTVGPAVHFAIVDNPWPDGMNDTEKSGEFTGQGKPTLFGIPIGQEIYFSKYPTIRLTAMARIGSEDNSLRVVVYNDEAGYQASGVSKTFKIAGEEEWNIIEFDVSNYPSKPAYYNRVGFLFNPDTWEDNYGVFVLDEIELVAATETLPVVLLRETFGTPNEAESYWRGEGARATVEEWGERFTSYNDATISCVTNDPAGLKLGNLWLTFPEYQPYKEAESICAGLDKGESLTFSNLYTKDITTITVSFAYLVWAGWQDMGASWAPQMRPTVEASVDGDTWVALQTASAFPPEEQVQLNEEYFGYAISSWFLLEYPTALTGDRLAIRISNQNEEEHTFYVDNIIVKGFLGTTGIKNIETAQAKAFVNNGIFTVLSDTNVKEIVVYNVAGNKLASKYNSNTLEVSSFPKGVYIASIVTGNNQKSVVKFVK